MRSAAAGLVRPPRAGSPADAWRRGATEEEAELPGIGIRFHPPVPGMVPAGVLFELPTTTRDESTETLPSLPCATSCNTNNHQRAATIGKRTSRCLRFNQYRGFSIRRNRQRGGPANAWFRRHA